MKKRLNVLCVVMLSIMIAEVVLSFLFGFSDMAEGFKDGYNDGRSSTMSFSSGLIGLGFVIAISYFGVRSFVTFVKFILNVNRDKVFVTENVSLLRATGWRLLAAFVLLIPFNLWFMKVTLETVFYNSIDSILFSVFCLLIAEVFAIGLRLKEEQDLTI